MRDVNLRYRCNKWFEIRQLSSTKNSNAHLGVVIFGFGVMVESFATDVAKGSTMSRVHRSRGDII